MLSIGTKAPDFNVLDEKGMPISSLDFKGKWLVLYFYPKALTPGCTAQACALRDHKDVFEDQNIALLGVSADAPEKLEKFKKRDALNFPLASDVTETKEMLRAYGAWGQKKFMGRTYDGILRITYIISPEGKVAHILPKVKTKTHHQDILSWFEMHKKDYDSK